MMWYPDKAAFRVGHSYGSEWDKDSIGTYSVAMGIYVKAKGKGSAAFGFATSATGETSFATGDYTKASGYNSSAMGAATIASGAYSFASGYYNKASGIISTAMGDETIASGNSSTALGNRISTNNKYGAFAIGDASTLGYTNNDADNQMLMRFIGGYKLYTDSGATQGLKLESNGVVKYMNNVASSYDNRSLVDKRYVDSLTGTISGGSSQWTTTGSNIYNNNTGNVGIGTSTPSAKLHVADSGVVFTAYGDVSYPYANPSVSGSGRRMMWYPEKAAFRVGYASGADWDNDSIGLYSIAMGHSVKARGSASFATGEGTNAEGYFSFAGGWHSQATNNGAFAIGAGTIVSGNYSFGTGGQTIVSNNYSFGSGYFSVASGYISHALGEYAIASGNYSFALGSKVSTNNKSGSLILGDHSTLGFTSNNADNQMMMRFVGGYKLHTDSGATQGLQITPNGVIKYLNNVASSYDNRSLVDKRYVDSLTGTISGGTSQWTTSGTNIYNNNTGKVLVGAVTTSTTIEKGRLLVKEDVNGGVGIKTWTSQPYGNAIYAADSGSSGNPIGCLSCSGSAAMRAYSWYGDALFLNSSDGRGLYLKGGNTFGGSPNNPAMVIDTNFGARALQVNGIVSIADGTQGAGKVLTSDASGNASWQSPAGAYSAGSGISIVSGVINAADQSATNEIQSLSLSGSVLSLSLGGGSITLPSGSSSPWAISGANIYNTNTGNVGFGTTSPTGKLHVADGDAVFAATHDVSFSPGDPAISGEGRRTLWYADKAAFRAGYVNGTQWDKDSTGYYSVAMGSNTKAKGDNSIAMGLNSVAIGASATAIGSGVNAGGQNATALGYNTTASGAYATAIGSGTIASGTASIAMGYQTIASGNGSTAMGGYVNTNSKMGAVAIGDRSGTSATNNDVDNQMMMRFAGGYKLYSNSAATEGVQITNDGVAKYLNNVASSYDNRSLVDKRYVDSLSGLGSSKWTQTGSNIYNNNTTGKVGIGTSTPVARFHVADSSVVFAASGDVSSSFANPPVSGIGRRTMWYPERAAFRAGYVNGTQWDRDSVGYYSVAMGKNTKAINYYSVALGGTTTASGAFSMATGNSTVASGNSATSIGHSSLASGDNSTAIGGGGPLASGANAMALGNALTANGDYSTALGNFITTDSKNGAFAIGDNSSAYLVGNDTDNQMIMRFSGGYKLYTNVYATEGVKIAPDGVVKYLNNVAGSYDDRSLVDKGYVDSLAGTGASKWTLTGTDIYNNNTAGKVGIGTSTPAARLHVADSNVVFAASGLAPTTAGNPSISGEGRRMMWYADKSAFRAGYVDAEQWDKDSIGNYSVAMGYKTKAKGHTSFAIGNLTTADGFNTTAVGNTAIASGDFATAIGVNVTATGEGGIAIGDYNTASAQYATAFGSASTASGQSAITLGTQSTASGDLSLAIGNYVTTNGKNGAVAIGDNSLAFSGGPTANDADNQMMMRFAGGYKLFSDASATVGVSLDAGGSSWNTISDRRKKENFAPVNGEDFLK